jgi:hypothetical protein
MIITVFLIDKYNRILIFKNIKMSSAISEDSINKALGYLRGTKREILNTTWSPNRFIRFRIAKENSSITEAILRTTMGKDFSPDTAEFDKFYSDLRKYLQRTSDKSEEEILKRLLKNDNLNQSLKIYDYRLIDPEKAKNIKDLNFFFTDNTSRGFPLIASMLENFKPNCNLFEYLASSKLSEDKLTSSYFSTRFKDKKLYNEINEDLNELKTVMIGEGSSEKNINTQELCSKIKHNINERSTLDTTEFFYKSLFSTEVIDDYRIYLYDMYPHIFKTNFIIMIPWSNDVTVEDMIIKDPSYPYIILFRPFERTNFTYETGAFLASGRRVKYIIYPEKDKNLLALIYINYNSNFSSLIKRHYKKYLEFKKDNEGTAADRYYEYVNRESTKYRYTGENKDISKFIKELKYYQTDIDDIIKNMNL